MQSQESASLLRVKSSKSEKEVAAVAFGEDRAALELEEIYYYQYNTKKLILWVTTTMMTRRSTLSDS